jgi:hypothetical protein|tara:strand:- start:1144 stop:1815 length:672 start_codon:yes stop_codon:yes gene_type:complete
MAVNQLLEHRMIRLDDPIDGFIYDYFMGRYVLEGARERFTWTDKQYEKENDITGVVSDRGSIDFGKDVLIAVMHKRLQKPLSELYGKELIPTYCFSRLYMPGALLQLHQDRPSCEVSFTYCHMGEPWSIQVIPENAKDNGDISGLNFEMSPGCGVYYRGCDEPHQRTQPAPSVVLQSFFHFVEKDGPHADHAYDALVGPSEHDPKGKWEDFYTIDFKNFDERF